MATGVGLAQISLAQFNNWSIPKSPIWCKNLGNISNTHWVIDNFLMKFLLQAIRVGLSNIWTTPFD